MAESSFSSDQSLSGSRADAIGASEERLRIGPWLFERAAGTLVGGEENRRLEPLPAALLSLLLERPGEVVPRDEISAALWPDAVVGEESIARCVSKLRRALGDDPKEPRFIETLPKRGYRLLLTPIPLGEATPVAAAQADEAIEARPSLPRRGLVAAASGALLAIVLVLAWSLGPNPGSPDSAGGSGEGPAVVEPDPARRLTDRAHDFYYQITRADNESAITLYERVIAEHPAYAPAQAGLANALVQRVIRWQSDLDGLPELDRVNLENAIAAGHTRTETASLLLERALGLAHRAVRLAPEDASAHKALGFVQSATEDRDAAIASYRRAIDLDPDAWDAMVNLSDLFGMRGDEAEELRLLEEAYATMSRIYDRQPQRIQPWHAAMAVLIGDRHAADGRPREAEIWYRRVLALEPLHPAATSALATLLRQSGDPAAAERLCAELVERTGARCTGEPDGASP